jgi:hypothetical protein
MKVLLVWEEVPENTKFYVLEGETAELALQCAGIFINSNNPEGSPIEQLSELLPTMKHHDIDSPIDGPFEKVVVAGFVM